MGANIFLVVSRGNVYFFLHNGNATSRPWLPLASCKVAFLYQFLRTFIDPQLAIAPLARQQAGKWEDDRDQKLRLQPRQGTRWEEQALGPFLCTNCYVLMVSYKKGRVCHHVWALSPKCMHGFRDGVSAWWLSPQDLKERNLSSVRCKSKTRTDKENIMTLGIWEQVKIKGL